MNRRTRRRWCFFGKGEGALSAEEPVVLYGIYLEQDLLRDSRARCGYTDRMLSMIDVLVDGRFVEALKDISLPFRGSSNQRILNLRATLESGSVKLLELGSGRI